MANAPMRLSQVARKLNVGTNSIVEHLAQRGHQVENNPNTKISPDQYEQLLMAFSKSVADRKEAQEMTIGQALPQNLVIDQDRSGPKRTGGTDEQLTIRNLENNATGAGEVEEVQKKEENKLEGLKVVGKIDLDKKPKKKAEQKPEPEAKAAPEKPAPKAEEAPAKAEAPAPTPEAQKEEPEKVIKGSAEGLKGLTVLGKIDLPQEKKREKPVASSDISGKRKRKRLRVDNKPGEPGKPGGEQKEITDKEIQDKIRATMAKMGRGKGGPVNRSKYRREKRSQAAEAREQEELEQEREAQILRVTEFISANDMASLMDVSVNEVISMCMSLGMFVSINQRLDAETISVIGEEFGFKVEFTTSEEEAELSVIEEVDAPDTLTDRAPVVTIMGHVDHGKTSLLDYIRESSVTEGEAGGITQHIGAYSVKTESGQMVTFLDTPGHEAFTAMRARGAKLTDIVVLVVAADDQVMPQTIEAINHARAAEVPIIVAITKIDKDAANPDKIKEGLSQQNILTEDWGGKFQVQSVSSKSGEGIPELLEKILIEAEVLELKANADKPAVGTVVEASLDKGRGYLSTVLVQGGTLRVGDVVLAGSHYGRVKAMSDHKGRRMDEAGPATPVQVLGLDGAPQSGDRFNILESDREAREIASKRAQIQREQNIRTRKHLTLDEIGRRLAMGSFQELNLIVKADVDGSVEALTDSLLKLSTDSIKVNVIHRGVGAVTESDVLLASTADAIILGFQVRPTANAKNVAEQEEIEIRHYSVIYRAIDEMKDALEGMLEPEFEEAVIGNVEVREVFKITKIGTVAGCYVTSGKIERKSKVRLIRDSIVKHEGEIAALKRFKDDVAEVKFGYECGLSIKNYNDILVGDQIEVYEVREIKRTLSSSKKD